jgi:hypothetical protein
MDILKGIVPDHPYEIESIETPNAREKAAS